MVGPTYGRKTMCGLLASEDLKVSETRVGQALQTVRPDYHDPHEGHKNNPKPKPKTIQSRVLWSKAAY